MNARERCLDISKHKLLVNLNCFKLYIWIKCGWCVRVCVCAMTCFHFFHPPIRPHCLPISSFIFTCIAFLDHSFIMIIMIKMMMLMMTMMMIKTKFIFQWEMFLFLSFIGWLGLVWLRFVGFVSVGFGFFPLQIAKRQNYFVWFPNHPSIHRISISLSMCCFLVLLGCLEIK